MYIIHTYVCMYYTYVASNYREHTIHIGYKPILIIMVKILMMVAVCTVKSLIVYTLK